MTGWRLGATRQHRRMLSTSRCMGQPVECAIQRLLLWQPPSAAAKAHNCQLFDKGRRQQQLPRTQQELVPSAHVMSSPDCVCGDPGMRNTIAATPAALRSGKQAPVKATPQRSAQPPWTPGPQSLVPLD